MNISTTTILDTINRSRIAGGLAPFTFNKTLSEFAQKKADDMMAKNYFSHTTPDGRYFHAFLDTNRYNYSYAGENLAKDFTDVEAMGTAWMNSETHRANILSKNYQDIGVAIKNNYVVTIFAKPMTSSVPVKPASSSAPVKTVPTNVAKTPVAKKEEVGARTKWIPEGVRVDNANSTIPMVSPKRGKIIMN